MKKSISQCFVLTAAVLACGTAFSQSLVFSKPSWGTHEGEAHFFVQPPFGHYQMGNCTFSNPEILAVSKEVLPSKNMAMIVIDEEKAKKLPPGDHNITVHCGPTLKKDFVVKNTTPLQKTASAVIEYAPGFMKMKAKVVRPSSEVVNPNIPVNFWVALQVEGKKHFLTGKRGAMGYWIQSEGEDDVLQHLIFSTQTADDFIHHLPIDFFVDDGLSYTQAKQPSAVHQGGDVSFALQMEHKKKSSRLQPETSDMPHPELYPVPGTDPKSMLEESIFYAKRPRPKGNIEKILIGYQVGPGEVQVVQTNWNTSQGVAPRSSYINADERYAFDELNKIRHLNGFGYVYQQQILDMAATAHAKYLELNYSKTKDAHNEDPNLPGFTGVLPRDRAKHFGYEGSKITESVDGNVHTVGSLFTLLGGPYHSLGLLYSQKLIGIGTSNENAIVFNPDTEEINDAYKKDEVFVYPCNNIQVNIQGQGYENPNPRPLNGKRDFGYSSVAIARTGIGFLVNSWDLFDANGKQVKTVLMHQEPISDFASLIPWDTLPRTKTSYTSVLKGTIKGVPFEKTCTWRTVVGNEFPIN